MSSDNFQDGAVFHGMVCDQILSRNRNDELQLVLTVKIEARLRDERNPRGDTEKIAAFERDVFLTFSDDPRLRGITESNLKRLGFEESDVLKLHPDHPDFLSLLGKEVHVRCRVKGESVYWNLAWFGFKPAAVTLKEARAIVDRLQPTSGLLSGDPPVDMDSTGGSGGDTPSVTY